MNNQPTNCDEPLRRLWWLRPDFALAAVVSITLASAVMQSKTAYGLYGTPKYVEPWHLLLGAMAVFSFAVGRYLAEVTGRVPQSPRVRHDLLVNRWFWITAALAAFGYSAWLLIGVKRGFTPGFLYDLLFTEPPGQSDYIRDEMFPTIPGVTTCTQFGVPAMLLGLWLYFRGQRWIIWPLGLLTATATVRAVMFGERTAVLELVVPGVVLGLRMCVLGRQFPLRWRAGLQAAPLVGIVGVVLLFGSFEYFRSWRWYRDTFDSYSEFIAWRMTGYFTTAHNNGAMALQMQEPRPLPFYSALSFWLFPGLRTSPLAYDKFTGFDPELVHKQMLEQYGNIELNNEGGLFQPTLDFGFGGGLLFWCAYGFVAGRLYRAFLVGTIGGVTLYPLIYFSILEVPLVLFIAFPRMFPALLTLAIVAWFTSKASPSRQPLAFGAVMQGAQ